MNPTIKQQAIEILSGADPIVCAGLIEKFVWANTTEPKFKIGDAILFSDRSTTIHRYKWRDGRREEQGQRVIAAIGKVVNVRRLLTERTFSCEIEYETDLEGWEVNGKGITSHKAFRLEADLRAADTYRPTLWSELSGTKEEQKK